MIAAILTYVAGALFWALLSVFGLQTRAASDTLWLTIADSAPDVPDALSFLATWSRYGQPMTEGRTFWGGLIPGNFPWNPSVWSITLGNETVNIQEVASGGLRLPAPIWGLVSFGLLGVILVPLVSGLLGGFVTKRLAASVDTSDTLTAAFSLTVYSAVMAVVSEYYVLTYMAVVQLAIAVLLVRSPAVGSVPRDKFRGSAGALSRGDRFRKP